MTPGDIRTMALRAVGFESDIEANAAGVGPSATVNAVEKMLLEMRAKTVREAAKIAWVEEGRRYNGGTEIGNLISQLIPPSLPEPHA